MGLNIKTELTLRSLELEALIRDAVEKELPGMKVTSVVFDTSVDTQWGQWGKQNWATFQGARISLIKKS